MTWNSMSHEEATFKAIVVDKNKPVGFELKGMTYDGDGNVQWEEGTDMQIIMKDEKAFRELILQLNKGVLFRN